MGRIAIGAGLGVAGGLLTVVLPLGFLLIASYAPGGFFTYSSGLVELASILLLAGAILFLLSLFAYRRSFALLRRADRRFLPASILCLVGTLGFLLVVIAAADLLGSSSALVNCLHGAPTHALSCLRSSTPFGTYTALIGFWLGWVGGLGIVSGLYLAGRRFSRGGLRGGAALYALLLLGLLAPFLALLVAVPGLPYVVLALPLLVLLAPASVYGGGRRPPGTIRP